VTETTDALDALRDSQQRAADFNAQRGVESAAYARARGMQNALGGASGSFTLHVDRVAEMLDELADLAEVWRRRRMAGQETGSTRVALLNAASAVMAVQEMERKA
jgi:hypothetical protein